MVKYRVEFVCGRELHGLILNLKKFFGLTTRSKVFAPLVLDKVCQISQMTPSQNWTPDQKIAHKACLRFIEKNKGDKRQLVKLFGNSLPPCFQIGVKNE